MPAPHSSLGVSIRARIYSPRLSVIHKSSRRYKKLGRVSRRLLISFIGWQTRRASCRANTRGYVARRCSLNPISAASNFHAALYRKDSLYTASRGIHLRGIESKTFCPHVPNIRTHLWNSNNRCAMYTRLSTCAGITLGQYVITVEQDS